MIEVIDALPADTAEALRLEFINGTYDRKEQHEVEFYGNNCKHDNPLLPDETEPFTAQFWKSDIFETPVFQDAFKQLVPKIEAVIGKPVEDAVVMAYKMGPGDHFRVHTDSYLGLGFILYLSKGWKWDWGGLLMATDGDGVIPYLPRFNSLVILQDAKMPHFVTQIAPAAREPRYTMVGFLK